MRRICITFLLGFVTLAIHAQHAFIQQGKNWHVIGFTPKSYLNFEHLTAPEYQIDYSFPENGDTLIEGVEYKRLVGIRENRIYDEKCIRENEGKVFFYDHQNKREELLYDFTLHIGETFTLYPNTLNEMRCEVTSVEDSLFCCGEKRRVICFDAFLTDDPLDPGTPNTWIEGIGYPRGPLAEVESNLVGGGLQLTQFVTQEILHGTDKTEKIKETIYASDFNTRYYYGHYYAEGKEKEINWDDSIAWDRDNFWDEYYKDDLHYEIINNKLHLYGYIYGPCCPEYLYLMVNKNHEIRFHLTPLVDILPPCAAPHEIDMYFPGFFEDGPYTIVDRSGEHHSVEKSWQPEKIHSIWEEGSVWEVHYKPDADIVDSPKTKVIYRLQKTDMQNYMALEKTLVENDMPGTYEVQGYIRTEGDTLIYVRPIMENGTIGEECLLYDFSTPFEYGNTITYGIEGGETRTEYIDWQKDSLDYYQFSGNTHLLPSWGGIIYRYGYIGGPLELFQRHCVPDKTKVPKPTNISHVIFTTKSGQKTIRKVAHQTNEEITVPYNAMLTDGTKWEYLTVQKYHSKNTSICMLEVIGDTIIGNRTCKLVTSPDHNINKVVFEEGRKLYLVSDNDDPVVLLDFGLILGDAIDEVTNVFDVSTIENQGNSYQIITIDTGIECVSHYAGDVAPWHYTLIEGIGVSKDEYLAEHLVLEEENVVSYLLRCWKGGTLVYQDPFYDTITGIRQIAPKKSSTIYDLQGRRLKNRLQKGILIIDDKKTIKR